MLLNISLLFILTLGAGLGVFFVPNIQNKNFRSLLSFSGAYLFSITVIHILPELFLDSKGSAIVGIFVLLGFYFQIMLDYFSTGVEHGHIHTHDHGHSHGNSTAILLFVSLMIHSLLEGTLLVHPHANHSGEEVRNVLFGLILHKIPESIALIAVLLFQLKNKKTVLVLLFIYSISSPVGLITSELIAKHYEFSGPVFTYLFGFVAGNFLHISTTIFFESEQGGHHFKGNKLIITSLGAAMAITAELFL